MTEPERTDVSEDFYKQVKGYGLTTATILYYKPGSSRIINGFPFIWQKYDLCPKFPVLSRFLEFWQDTIEGKLHAVFVAHSALIKPLEINSRGGTFRLQ